MSPVYDYECSVCGHVFEKFFKINDREQYLGCQICPGTALKIVSSNIERVEPTWLKEAVNHAVPHGSDIQKPRDRNEFNRYLKENNIDHVG